MEATQPTFNQVYEMACMLPRVEQQMLLNKMTVFLHKEDDLLRERKEHIAESERQIAAGKVYSEEESDKMIEKIFEELSSVAV